MKSNIERKLNMTKIFIWKSYGDIEVYDISTIEKYKAVLNEILDICEDYCIEDCDSLCRKVEYATEYGELNSVTNILIDELLYSNDDNAFQYLGVGELK